MRYPIGFPEFKDWFDTAMVQAEKQITFSLDYIIVLYAQSLHETDHYKSNVYQTFNNIFGMRTSLSRGIYWDVPAGKSDQYAGTKVNNILWTNNDVTQFQYREYVKQKLFNKEWSVSPYAYYNHTIMSLVDRVNWDASNKIVYQSAYQYMKDVQAKGYATDTSYITKWRNMVSTVCDSLGIPRIWLDSDSTPSYQPVETTVLPDINVSGLPATGKNILPILIGLALFLLR